MRGQQRAVRHGAVPAAGRSAIPHTTADGRRARAAQAPMLPVRRRQTSWPPQARAGVMHTSRPASTRRRCDGIRIRCREQPDGAGTAATGRRPRIGRTHGAPLARGMACGCARRRAWPALNDAGGTVGVWPQAILPKSSYVIDPYDSLWYDVSQQGIVYRMRRGRGPRAWRVRQRQPCGRAAPGSSDTEGRKGHVGSRCNSAIGDRCGA